MVELETDSQVEHRLTPARGQDWGGGEGFSKKENKREKNSWITVWCLGGGGEGRAGRRVQGV